MRTARVINLGLMAMLIGTALQACVHRRPVPTYTWNNESEALRVLASRQRLADSAAQEVTGEASDAVADTLHAEQREIVARALATLPEEQRRTLKLAYFEGLTQSEIATQLGTPLGTVKTRMRTGMMKLRELLGEQMRGLLGSELG